MTSRPVAIKLAHQGQQGITKTNVLVQVTCKPKAPQPVHPAILPTVELETINVDYLGPLPNGK